MAANARVDPILIACLVDSSVALLHEWNQILQSYISPLLQRIAIHSNAKSNRHLQETIRIGFVSYSDCNIHPNPILTRRFFAPVGLMTKELKDDPVSLGLGQTAPREDAGMAVLEGYVAVLEMFDAVAETRPLPPQTAENAESLPYEPTFYLLHIAATQPDNASKPVWNQSCLLDDVTWSSLPSEISKRKIRHNMILTRPILQLQELHKNVHRNLENHGIPVFKSSHMLLFFGLPSDVKTIPQKRGAPDSIDVKPSQASSPKSAPTPASPSKTAAPQAVIPNQTNAGSDIQVPANNNQPPQSSSSSAPSNPPQQQGVQRFDLNRLKMIIGNMENDIQNTKATLEQARAAGKAKPELDALDNEINLKTLQKAKAMHLYHMTVLRNQAAASTAAQQSQSANPGAPAARVSTHIPPSNVNTNANQSTQDTQAAASSNPFPNISAQVTRPGINAQLEKLVAERMRPPVVAAAPIGVQSQQLSPQSQPQLQSQLQPQPQPQLQPSAPPPPPPQPQPQPQPQSQLKSQPQLQAQAQFQPQPHLQSQSQPQSQLQPQLQPQPQPQPQPRPQPQQQSQPQPQPQRPPQGLSVPAQNPVALSNQAIPPGLRDILADRPKLGNFPRKWQGFFTWPVNSWEVPVRVALYTHDTTLHPESWPQRLHFIQSHISINPGQIQTWYKEKSAVMSLVSFGNIPGNDEATLQNYRLFKSVRDWCQSKSLSFYCQFDLSGAPQGSGALLFPLQSPNSTPSPEAFVCMIFNKASLPAEVLKPLTMPSNQAVDQGDFSTNPQAIPSTTMHNMSNPNSDAFLQQQKMQHALALQKRQELAQQANAQRNMMQNLVGISTAPFGGMNGLNVNQLLQAGQQQPLGTTEQMIMNGGGSGLNVVPQAQQQLMSRQVPPGIANLTAAQMAHLLQFGMNRSLDGSNGQS